MIRLAEEETFMVPSALAVDRAGRIVVSYEHGSLEVLTPDGRHVWSRDLPPARALAFASTGDILAAGCRITNRLGVSQFSKNTWQVRRHPGRLLRKGLSPGERSAGPTASIAAGDTSSTVRTTVPRRTARRGSRPDRVATSTSPATSRRRGRRAAMTKRRTCRSRVASWRACRTTGGSPGHGWSPPAPGAWRWRQRATARGSWSPARSPLSRTRSTGWPRAWRRSTLTASPSGRSRSTRRVGPEPTVANLRIVARRGGRAGLQVRRIVWRRDRGRDSQARRADRRRVPPRRGRRRIGDVAP